MVACQAGTRRADTLDIFMRGPEAPVGESWREPKSVFSGVNIVQPPGGQSSVSFGNYSEQHLPPGTGQTESHPRSSGSPLYGRRASSGQQYAPARESQYAARHTSNPESSRLPSDGVGAHLLHPKGPVPYSDGAAAYGPAQQSPYVAYAVGLQSLSEGRRAQAVSTDGPRSQSWMGGKNIVQAPGGASSISFGWDAPQQPGQREVTRAASRNTSSAAYAYTGIGNEVVGSPLPPRPSLPPSGGEYSQHYMGGKTIVQAPGGTSSLSLGWGQSAEPPPVHVCRSRRGMRAEITPPVGGSRQGHRPPPSPGYSGTQEYPHIPKPHVQSGRHPVEPTFSGVPILQPPGGRQSINIFG